MTTCTWVKIIDGVIACSHCGQQQHLPGAWDKGYNILKDGFEAMHKQCKRKDGTK